MCELSRTQFNLYLQQFETRQELDVFESNIVDSTRCGVGHWDTIALVEVRKCVKPHVHSQVSTKRIDLREQQEIHGRIPLNTHTHTYTHDVNLMVEEIREVETVSLFHLADKILKRAEHRILDQINLSHVSMLVALRGVHQTCFGKDSLNHSYSDCDLSLTWSTSTRL
jgi:hypothetical protein